MLRNGNGHLDGEPPRPVYIIAAEHLQPVLDHNIPHVKTVQSGEPARAGYLLYGVCTLFLLVSGYLIYDHAQEPWNFKSVSIEPADVTLADVAAEKPITVCKSGTWFRAVPRADTFQSWTPVDAAANPTGDTIPANKHTVKLPAAPVTYPLNISNCRSVEADGSPALTLDRRMTVGRYMLTIETWTYPYGSFWPVHGKHMQAKAFLTVR